MDWADLMYLIFENLTGVYKAQKLIEKKSIVVVINIAMKVQLFASAVICIPNSEYRGEPCRGEAKPSSSPHRLFDPVLSVEIKSRFPTNIALPLCTKLLILEDTT